MKALFLASIFLSELLFGAEPVGISEVFAAALKRSETIADQQELIEQANQHYTQAFGSVLPTISGVEFIYAVTIDKATGEKLPNSEFYQSDQFGGIGHDVKKPFKGKYLPDSQHPIIYDFYARTAKGFQTSTLHNVFRDSPLEGSTKLIGYHLVPEPIKHEILPNESRECVQCREFPWLCEISDCEMRRENKFALPFTDYLYVEVKGVGRHFRVDVTLDDKVYYAGVGENKEKAVGAFNDFEDDMWNKARFAAVPITRNNLDKIGRQKLSGSVIITKRNENDPELTVEEVKFYRASKDEKNEKISFEEVTKQVNCEMNKDGSKIPKGKVSTTVCTFK